MISGHSLSFRLFWLLALADFGGQAAAQSITLTYVGARTIATGTTVGGVEFGGISGISYNPYTDRFVAVTDDSRAAGASRLWTIALGYESTKFTSAAAESSMQLKTEGNLPLPLADTEGIAGNLDGSFYLSHEGLAAGSDPVSSIPPWILRFDGATGRRVPGDFPIVEWNFTGTVGQPATATDAAAPLLDGANNGTISGGHSYQAGPPGCGTALSIGAARVTTTFSPALVNNTQQVTMAAWIRPNVINPAIGNYVLGGIGFIRFSGSGQLNVGFFTSASWVEAAGGQPASWYVGAWNHVAATFDNGTVSLWVNGALVATNTTHANGGAAIAASASDWTGQFIVGGAPGDAGDFSYNGLVDEVRLLNFVQVAPYPTASSVRPEAALPVKFLPRDTSGNAVAPSASNQTSGVVSNLSLECLGITPSRRFLFTANEAALKQDYSGTYNSDSNQAQNSETRIVRFGGLPDDPSATQEKVYRADQGTLFFVVRRFNTVPEVLPVDDGGRLLVMERGLTANNTNTGSYRIRIYLVDFNQANATDVAGINALVGASYTRLTKTLLWESSSNMDNVEAMCWGRDIDGFRTLVLASDNNFSGAQASQFHVLRTNIPAVARRNLALTTAGSGSVGAAPPAAWYPDGAEVKVTATPSPAWTFDAWLGTSTDATNPLALTMDADKSLSARFLAPYDIWLKGHFTAQEIADSIITTPGADPDFDGMANLLESAAGLDPRARDTAGTPAADVSGGWFTLTYRRDASRTDITCQVESSGDLGQPGWLPISDEYVGNEGGFEWRRASVPLSEGRKFLRLKVGRLF
jgi:hypothetical protein